MTDLELINACLDGQQIYFTELISRYKNLVYSIILRMTKNGDDADDLAQDVFLKIYKNLPSYSPEFKFSTWIMRITNNHVIDFHRKRKHETVPIESVELSLSCDGTPEAEFLTKEKNERIHQIVESLPTMYKVPIMMYHLNNMGYQEIADKLNEPLSKIKNRIFRGRKILKTLYAEEGR